MDKNNEVDGPQALSPLDFRLGILTYDWSRVIVEGHIQRKNNTPAPKATHKKGPAANRKIWFSNIYQYVNFWAPLSLDELRASVVAKVVGDGRCQVSTPLYLSYSGPQHKLEGDIFSLKFSAPTPITIDNNDRFDKESIALLVLDLAPFRKTPLVTANTLEKDTLYNKLSVAKQRRVTSANSKRKGEIHAEVCHEFRKNAVIPALVTNIGLRNSRIESIKLDVAGGSWKSYDFDIGTVFHLVVLSSTITNQREYHTLQDLWQEATSSESFPEDDLEAIFKQAPASRTKFSVSMKEHLCFHRAMQQKVKDNHNRFLRSGDAALDKVFIHPSAFSRFNRNQMQALAAATSTEDGFVLIKGPPGTGKTTTITGLLNALHVFGYHEHYQNILQEKPGLKPRILVCAQSNVAVDNIIAKLADVGCVSMTGDRYFPEILRIGRGTTKDLIGTSIYLDDKVSALMDKEIPVLEEELRCLQERVQYVCREKHVYRNRYRMMKQRLPSILPANHEIGFMDDPTGGQFYFVDNENEVCDFNVIYNNEGPPVRLEETVMYREFERIITETHEEYENLQHMEHIYSMVLHAKSRGVDVRQEGKIRDELRRKLETAYVSVAQIFFTTLQGSSSDFLKNINFTELVVDEACQCVELSTLIPLGLNIRKCILIGDPEQLPATTFGDVEQYETSLFERLSSNGHPVNFLNEQYRMHPTISAFPREYFYNSELLDGGNVKTEEYTKPFHAKLSPMTCFDVTGMEDRSSSSIVNHTEADGVLRVFTYLVTHFLPDSDLVPPENPPADGNPQNLELWFGRVGILTPYKAQKIEIEKRFIKKFGSAITRLVDFNTVDSFQGKEKDVIIMSTVRAASTGSIGFLADTRRMNVAITRAKYGFFMVGKEDTLNRNCHWASLISYVKQNGMFVNLERFMSDPDASENTRALPVIEPDPVYDDPKQQLLAAQCRRWSALVIMQRYEQADVLRFQLLKQKCIPILEEFGDGVFTWSGARASNDANLPMEVICYGTMGNYPWDGINEI